MARNAAEAPAEAAHTFVAHFTCTKRGAGTSSPFDRRNRPSVFMIHESRIGTGLILFDEHQRVVCDGITQHSIEPVLALLCKNMKLLDGKPLLLIRKLVQESLSHMGDLDDPLQGTASFSLST